jgi:TolB-like protein/Tfp pilus assembly protein PilF
LIGPSPVVEGAGEIPTRTLTGDGRIVGTVAYMSPEQAEGGPVDHRSDIFSMGVLIYELATGERPFTGDTNVSLLSSIIKDTPRSVTDLKPTLPRELARIIKHCLVKDPEYRCQSAKNLRNELRDLQQDSDAGAPGAARVPAMETRPPAVTSRRKHLITLTTVLALVAVALIAGLFWRGRTSTSGPIDSLAVLPFVNVGADPNAEYLSDGITENLINSLSQLPQLRVVPRSTVFRFKGRQVDLATIGRELGVRAILTGRVVERGDTLNIQTDLIDVSGDSQLWGRQYTRSLADLITVQEEIATAIAERLGLRPTADDQKRLTRHSTENFEAHQLYLKGQFYWNRRTADRLQQATDYFRQAIEKDPGYGRAWAALADCYALYGFYGVGSPRDAGPRGKEAALSALRIDDTLSEAHTTLAWIKATYEWDFAGAEQAYKRAIELNPNNGLARSRYGVYFEAQGRMSEALEQGKQAQAREPLSLIINSVHGRRFYYDRQYERALEELSKVLELDANFAQAHLYLGWVYEQQARHEDAITELQKAFTLSGGESEIVGALGHAYAISGRRGEAEKILKTLNERSTQGYVAPFDFALIHAGLGAKDATFEWLEKAFADHSTWLFWIKVDPRFDSIRDDVRYHELVRRMRFPK